MWRKKGCIFYTWLPFFFLLESSFRTKEIYSSNLQLFMSYVKSPPTPPTDLIILTKFLPSHLATQSLMRLEKCRHRNWHMEISCLHFWIIQKNTSSLSTFKYIHIYSRRNSSPFPLKATPLNFNVSFQFFFSFYFFIIPTLWLKIHFLLFFNGIIIYIENYNLYYNFQFII